MRLVVVIGCALLLLLAGQPVRAQSPQPGTCETFAIPPNIDLNYDFYGTTLAYTPHQQYADGQVGLWLDVYLTNGVYRREYSQDDNGVHRYTVTDHTERVRIGTIYARSGDLEICWGYPATPTPTATTTATTTPAPTVTPTGTPQPTAIPYIIPVLPTITTHDNLLDLLPEHSSAISESATGAGFPLLAVLIWLIGWFGLLWLVRR
jgi:hypothetical protein